MKISLFAKYDNSGASSRYRTLQYLPYLQKKNIEITVNSLLDENYITKIYSKQKVSIFYYLIRYFQRAYTLLSNRNTSDLYWIEGELFPYLPYFLEKIFLPKYYVAEYDDAIFHNYDLHRNKLVRKLLGNKIQHIMRNSQHVIVGNEYVKEYCLKAGAKKITVIPTVVDADTYKPSVANATVGKPINIGWLGSPTTVKYLAILKPVLKNVAKKANVSLLIIGGEYKIEGITNECFHWPDKWCQQEEITLLNKIDIGIMPLPDSPWEKGKCGFKLIKYMACAKPIIASPVSMNQEIVSHGINGYLASSLEDWEKYLLELISDAEKRKEFGKAGQIRMREKYSLQTNAPIILNTLINAIK